MIRHLIRLVWNRKRTNALLAIEMFFSFLVLASIVTAVVFYVDAWRKPLGFDYRNVWKIDVDTKGTGQERTSQTVTGSTPDDAAARPQQDDGIQNRFERLLREIEAFEQVESAAGAVMGPYETGSMTGRWQRPTGEVALEMSVVTDRFADVVNLDLVRGRWFEPSDSASPWKPVVIDMEAARAFYGTDDPLGRVFDEVGADGSGTETRVVGLVSDFRRKGELGAQSNYVFRRLDLTADDSGMPRSTVPRSLFIRLKPGTTVEFEEPLLRTMLAVAPEWSFEVTPLERARQSMFRIQLIPVIIGGVIALFLLLMVCFGLIGVLWQTVTQRTSELALRRALGATRGAVGMHVVLEMIVVATAGIVAGTLIVAQVPALGLFTLVPPAVFGTGLTLSLVVMYVMVVISALYPGLLATRIEPAAALRSE